MINLSINKKDKSNLYMPNKEESEKLPNILKDYSKYWLHRVNKNETLKTISYLYFGNSKKWNEIYQSNLDRIKDSNIIFEGQIIRIPRD